MQSLACEISARRVWPVPSRDNLAGAPRFGSGVGTWRDYDLVIEDTPLKGARVRLSSRELRMALCSSRLERETGIEPATSSLGRCEYSARTMPASNWR